MVSKIDPAMLEKSSAPMAIEKPYEASRTFADMKLSPQTKANLKKKGYQKPSEIQDKTIDQASNGRDILGIAQTGTGKTAAFLLPLIEQLIKQPTKSHTLVMVPTRELAKQVEEEFRSMAHGLKLYSSCFIGGTNINRDLQNLRRPSHMVIGTPGRILDLVKRRALDLRPFQALVLDEFDRMLDMGFVHDVQRIIDLMPRRKQTMLFSATVDEKQKSLISELLHRPFEVRVSNGKTTGDHVDQSVIRLDKKEVKFDVLCDMLKDSEFSKVIIFEEAKHKVAKLNKALRKSGFHSDEIHGNKSQSARQQALKGFRSGKTKVLVATDVAARGIDVDDISHVINYRLPLTYDSYIHRIGRTGRAGKAGKAITFVD